MISGLAAASLEAPSRMAALVIPRISNALALHQWRHRRNTPHWNVVSSVSNCCASGYLVIVEIIQLPPITTSYLVHCTIPCVPTVASDGRLGTRRSLSHIHYISLDECKSEFGV